jgi:hypothetical protein
VKGATMTFSERLENNLNKGNWMLNLLAKIEDFVDSHKNTKIIFKTSIAIGVISLITTMIMVFINIHFARIAFIPSMPLWIYFSTLLILFIGGVIEMLIRSILLLIIRLIQWIYE